MPRKGSTLPEMAERHSRALLSAYFRPLKDKLGTLRLLGRQTHRTYHDAALANNTIISMFTQFAMDLRLARKVAGLTQDDCATLMNRSRKYVLRLEKGAREPSLDDLLCLSVIYNRTFEDYVATRLKVARATVRAGLPQLPVTISNHAGFRQRCHTLDRIERDLLAEAEAHGD